MAPGKILIVVLLSLPVLAQNVVTNPTSSQNIVQPPNTSFSANSYAGILYVVPSYNWQQSPTVPATITGGTPTMVTLSPCPAGILFPPSGSLYQPSTRLWLAGSGTPEVVTIITSTCPLQGQPLGTGTVTFVPTHNHGGGYTLGSASSGIQEAINAANFTTTSSTFVQNGVVVIPPGQYTVKARITILGNGQSVQGAGAILNCSMTDTCLFIGDSVHATYTSDVTIDGLSFQPGVSNNTFAMVEDNGQHSTIRNLRGQGPASSGPMFGSMVQIDGDQSATIDGLDANNPPTSSGSWASCTSSFCSTVVRGASSGGNVSVISIKNSVIDAECNANGVDVGTGGGFADTLKITDSIVQAYPQFGIRYRATYPNIGLVLDNVYQEVGNCPNPLFNNLQSQAGVIALGPQVRNTNGAAGAGNFPQFYMCTPVNTCTNNVFYAYWVVGHSSAWGDTIPLLVGTGATDGTVTGGTIYWPQMCQLGSCGAVTYDVLRTTSTTPGYSGIVPSGTLPGGVGDNGAITTLNSGSCSNTVCSFFDTLSTATTMYPVHDLPSHLWNDALAYWPGSFVLTGNAENEGWQYVARLYTDVLPYNGTPMISSFPGPGGVPSVYAQDCSGAPIVGSPLWMSCLASDPVGGNRNNSGPMVLQNGATGSFSPTIPMGRIIFEGGSLNLGAQDLITFGDSNQGVNLFSSSGSRPQANAGDCAIAADNGNTTNWGLAFRCPFSISSYINSMPDGVSWLEQLTTSAKTFNTPITANFQINSTLLTNSNLAPFTVKSTVPVDVLTVSSHPTIQYCGTGTTCQPVPQTNGQIVFGTITLSSGSQDMGGINPAFQHDIYTCLGNDLTTPTNGVKVVPKNSTTVTFTGTKGDIISYQCVGS